MYTHYIYIYIYIYIHTLLTNQFSHSKAMDPNFILSSEQTGSTPTDRI